MRVIDVTPLRPPPSPAPSRTWAVALTALLFAAVGWRIGSSHGAQGAPPQAPVVPAAPRAELRADELATIELFRSCSPAVVHIANVAVYESLRRNPVEIPLGTGTGFVWDDAGHVVTNYHVVAEHPQADRRVYVKLAGEERTREAEVVGEAPNHDLAVLKLIEEPSTKLQALAIGSSDDLQVGQRVYAIGNPFGLDQTLTTGVISGLNREIRSQTNHKIGGVIQTDAAINPGNSGGPLLDSSGRVIGVNTAIVSPSGAYAGIGFAVPIDVLRRVVPELIVRGKVARPGLGIVLLDDQAGARLGLRGVGVLEAVKGGAAERAGLRSLVQHRSGEFALDEIVSIDGLEVRSQENLLDVLDAHAVGDVVTLGVRRGAKLSEIKVELQSID